jgi:hypothetical protein
VLPFEIMIQVEPNLNPKSSNVLKPSSPQSSAAYHMDSTMKCCCFNLFFYGLVVVPVIVIMVSVMNCGDGRRHSGCGASCRGDGSSDRVGGAHALTVVLMPVILVVVLTILVMMAVIVIVVPFAVMVVLQ